MGTSKRILVTGGNGFVGRHFLNALHGPERSAWTRIVAGLRSEPGFAAKASEEIQVGVDLTDAGAVAQMVSAHRPDIVVHLAAQASVGASLGAAEQTWTVNLLGTFNLAAAIARTGCECVFLQASTAEVYGASFVDGIATEETPIRPTNAYARSKAAAEALLVDILPKTCKLIIARPFNHTGPGQDERFVVSSFAAQIARMEAGLAPPSLSVGNLEAERTFLDVRDVVRAYLALIDRANEIETGSIVNIASDYRVPIRRIVDALRGLACRPFEITQDPARLRPNDIPVAAGSWQRLHDLTGWRPEISLDQTLADLLSYHRQQFAR
jgi:GDP-4-dehydro-6-deoxy-D-mannose reductase